jgi:hypothetical protein
VIESVLVIICRMSVGHILNIEPSFLNLEEKHRINTFTLILPSEYLANRKMNREDIVDANRADWIVIGSANGVVVMTFRCIGLASEISFP